MFTEYQRPLHFLRAVMQLSPAMRVMAFLLVLGLAKQSELPRPADTIEYLRLLASLKAGNVSLTAQNVSTSAPWTYNLQSRKFQQKLQEGEIIFNFQLSKCQSERV